MQAKKDDLPAMPFYWGDWFKSMDVQSLPRDVKCVWFEMLGRMWESNERGFLTINDKPMTDFAKASALGFGEDVLKYLAYEKQIEEAGLFSRREKDNAIFSRKILKLVDIRTKRQEAGKIGGIKTQASAKASAKATSENEYENETVNENEAVVKVINNRKEQILIYCQEQGYPIEEGEAFFDHYQALGWLTNAGLGIVDWKAKMRTWHKEQTTRKSNGLRNTQQGKGSIDPDKYKRLASKEPIL